MKRIQLITFKGCQSTINFHNQLESLIKRENIKAEIEMIIVPSPKRAREMGLFGAPTILVNGLEYQWERRGPAGFY